MKQSHQAHTVLTHMRQEPFITSWAAEGVYRIRRLASRIDELVASGFDIEKETAFDRTGQRYTRYSLSPRQRRQMNPVNPPRARVVRVSLDGIADSMRDLGHCECAINTLINRLKESA